VAGDAPSLGGSIDQDKEIILQRVLRVHPCKSVANLRFDFSLVSPSFAIALLVWRHDSSPRFLRVVVSPGKFQALPRCDACNGESPFGVFFMWPRHRQCIRRARISSCTRSEERRLTTRREATNASSGSTRFGLPRYRGAADACISCPPSNSSVIREYSDSRTVVAALPVRLTLWLTCLDKTRRAWASASGCAHQRVVASAVSA